MTTLAELTERFAIADCLRFELAAEDFPVAVVTTPLAQARIALQGAHLMSYQAVNQLPLIWLSPAAKLAPGKSIRGGIPLCWPWFGPHERDAKLPGHGFARTVPWALEAARLLPDGRLRLEFALIESETTRAQWPHACTARHVITIGQELEVALETTNTGAAPFTLGQALHTYFVVGDVRQVSVLGLEGCTYLDKVAGGARAQQVGPLSFSGETDRVYFGTSGYCVIRDPVLAREIIITATGSRSTVVWTPWAEKAAKMGDFGSADGWLDMLCVENANALDDVIVLAPGQSHCLAAQYRAVAWR